MTSAQLRRVSRRPIEAIEHRSRVSAELEQRVRKALTKLVKTGAPFTVVGLTPDGGHLTGGTAGLTGRMSVCRASVRSTPRSFGSRLPAW